MINLTQEFIILEISGADATTFLQGQTTNDIKSLENAQWQFSAHLNHKGRILAIFLVHKCNEQTYWLFTHKSISESIVKRLKMFVLRSKVQITMLQKNIYFIQTSDVTDTMDISPATEENQIDDTEIVIKLNEDNSLLISTSELSANEGLNFWNKYLVDHKIVFINDKLEGLFTPHHIEFTGISYTKGCYTGQEIVARTHYLGKSKKYLDTIISKQHLNIADEIDYPQNPTQTCIVLNYYTNQDDCVYLVCV